MTQPASGHGLGNVLWRREWWPLLAVLLATVVVYAPSLNSPLYGDDYIYLTAARELSFGEYARAVFTPWGNEPLLPFTRDFWRPLAFVWFEIAEPWFGGTPAPYHIANLAVHLVSVVLVWLVAKRLDARLAVRCVAAAAFALYPGSFEAVTWISSFNSAGLPFALGAWLAFLAGTGGSDVRWRPVATSAGLIGVGLMFRESATALLPATGLWYLLVQQRDRTREWRTYLPFLPFVAVGIAYYLVRTRLFTEPFVNDDIYRFDSTYAERWWFYMENALLPFRDPVTGWRRPAQDFGGILLLAVPAVALLRRRWDVLALSVGLIVSTLPYGATILGVGQRYFYFSSVVLCLGVGVLAADVVAVVTRRWAGDGWRVRRMAPAAGLAVVMLVLGASTFSRIRHWNEIGPDRQQAWVTELRETYPELPEGGSLYCANVPLILALFGAANLEPTVRWYYPELGAVRHVPSRPPELRADDRYFEPGQAATLPAPPVAER